MREFLQTQIINMECRQRGDTMKRIVLLVLFFIGSAVDAQNMPTASNQPKYPDLQYKVVKDFLKISSDMPMAEAVGVAINSKGHILKHFRNGWL
jgi:hypothetical protein